MTASTTNARRDISGQYRRWRLPDLVTHAIQYLQANEFVACWKLSGNSTAMLSNAMCKEIEMKIEEQ